MKFLPLCLLLSYHLAFSQEESFPCNNANPALKNLFSDKQLASLYIHACSGEGLHGLTSSFLKPSGETPTIIESPDGDPPDDDAYVRWTCKYAPGNLQDNDPKTAWVEGVDGYGAGEVVIVPCLDLQKPIEIWAGYGKSGNLFMFNSRPSKVRLYIIESQIDDYTQYGTAYKSLTILTMSETTLQDINGFQPLTVPAFSPAKYYSEKFNKEMDYSYFLGLEILDVFKGSKWKDTCISEIRNTKQDQ